MSALKLWVSSSIVSVALVGGMAMSATAQQSGLVNVNTGNILSDIAIDLNVDISQIPITVQAPIGIAANVCNVAVNVLAQAAQRGSAECDAQTTSTAFNRIVQRQMSQ